MKFHIFSFILAIILMGTTFSASAQVDSVIGQVTSANFDSFAGGISGDGRFIVFESTGDVGTVRDENNLPNNADGNREIFLFDYAQRRIFQITNTKSLLNNTANLPTFDNIKVEITNLRPVISNDGKWIAFGSNATTSTPAAPDSTNPGNFDANAFTNGTGANPLTSDGNTEIWVYEVPAVPAVTNLSAGDEIPFANLAGGTFTRVTNTNPSRLPVAGSTTRLATIADDNRDPSIDDLGNAVSFTSNRDVVPCTTTPSAACGNAAGFDNDEIFSYIRNTSSPFVKQVTTTPRGSISNPIFNINSTITNLTAGGWRIAFMSNGNAPVSGMATSNADGNEEIFYVDLDSTGNYGTRRVQITNTTRTNPGDVVNLLNLGRRMSRDGRYIAFDSYADLESENNGTNQPGFSTFIYDTERTTRPFERILARSNADSAASGGDIPRFPGFTEYDANRSPQAIVFETRMNVRGSDGTVPSNADEGLNNIAARPAQIYSSRPIFIQQPESPGTRIARPVTRISKLPTPSDVLAFVQPLPTNSLTRMSFNLARTEVGTGNPDASTEVYYLINPTVNRESTSSFSFSTGASRLAVSPSPVPTPTATPTPSPTPTPTVTPSPTPTPGPTTPLAVQGVAPGMLAILDYDSGLTQPVAARTAVGSIDRRFSLPIELSGVTMTVNGAAAGIKFVSRRQIVFVVPPGLPSSTAGVSYPVVINNNGLVIKGNVTVVPARPDIFTNLPTPGPGGRAKIFNATNRVLLTEPFPIRTFKLRGSRLVPTVLRVYITGLDPRISQAVTVRIGNSSEIVVDTVTTPPVLVEPGVYALDFSLPATLQGAGDQPIILTITAGGTVYQSRLDDTAPRLTIL